MGGKLVMTMSTSADFMASQTATSMESLVKNSFGAGVGGWGLSSSASTDYSNSVGGNSDLQGIT